MSDILDAIDEVTAAVCGWCQEPLRADGPILLYCGVTCQWEFNQLQGERLVGYREPTDLPMHVANLHEEYSPEVTPGALWAWDYVYGTEPDLFPSMTEWMLDRLNATLADYRDLSFVFDVPRGVLQGVWGPPFSGTISYTRAEWCPSDSPWVAVEQPQREQMPDLPAVKAEDLFAYAEDGSPIVAEPQMPETPPLRAGFGYELIADQVQRRERRRW